MSNPIARDLETEAAQWRENLRPSSPLVEPLSSAQGPTLIDAYLLWWQIYTAGIRRAPSANRPDGVAHEHVVPVVREANDAVLEFLSAPGSRAWMAQCSEPPEEEPVPDCAHPDKRKYRSRSWADAGAKGIRKKVGETAYQTLYPYECPAGGHWHLSHYRQGKAKCPACQMPQAAWKGGEDYWVIAKHEGVDVDGSLCRGTGERVRQGVAS